EAFFNRLADDGIDKTNTLFVFTADEGDHYAGGAPTNQATCDGVTTPCTYDAGTTGPNTIGEITANIDNALSKKASNTTPSDIHFDDAPTFYVHPPGTSSPLGPNDPRVRSLERDAAGITLDNPRTGKTDVLTQHIADETDEGLLHMINNDPLRTPQFTLFGNPDYFLQTGRCGAGNATQAGLPRGEKRVGWHKGPANP